MVRTVVAVVMSLGALMAGFWAISTQAQQTEPTLNSTASESAFNASVSVFGGLGDAAASMLPWMGVGAIVIIALGLLVASSGGR